MSNYQAKIEFKKNRQEHIKKYLMLYYSDKDEFPLRLTAAKARMILELLPDIEKFVAENYTTKK